MAGKKGWIRAKGAGAKPGQKIILPPKKRPKSSRFSMKKNHPLMILIWRLILMNSDFLTSRHFLFIGM